MTSNKPLFRKRQIKKTRDWRTYMHMLGEIETAEANTCEFCEIICNFIVS